MAAQTPSTQQRTIGQLVADTTQEMKGLLQAEVALAKAEVGTGAKKIGKGAGLLGAAAFVGVFGLTFLLHAFARIIGIWLPVWAGYLIVAGALLLVAGILALVGRKAITAAKPKPDRAIVQAQETVAALKQAR